MCAKLQRETVLLNTVRNNVHVIPVIGKLRIKGQGGIRLAKRIGLVLQLGHLVVGKDLAFTPITAKTTWPSALMSSTGSSHRNNCVLPLIATVRQPINKAILKDRSTRILPDTADDASEIAHAKNLCLGGKTAGGRIQRWRQFVGVSPATRLKERLKCGRD